MLNSIEFLFSAFYYSFNETHESIINVQFKFMQRNKFIMKSCLELFEVFVTTEVNNKN